MKILAGLGAAAVLALSGCAVVDGVKPRAHLPTNCGPGACQFDVIVTSCDYIDVSQDPIVVEPGHRGPIQWKLPPHGGWEFADGGIQIQQGTDGEFAPAAGNGPYVVTWNNNHRHPRKTYKYDVIVKRSTGGPTCRWDPSIMN